MDETSMLRYFLGANTADGFYNLFDSFTALDSGDFLWIIKGGAGCGKSSFMKMLGAAGERAGYMVEYAYCSGDPNSLDGVYIPALRCAYVDGTAPHVMDARIAALDSAYLDLGAFYDIAGISRHSTELQGLKSEIAQGYKRAYALLGAAGALKRGWISTYISSEDLAHSRKRISSLAKRNIPRNKGERGAVKQRFLSAISCKGFVSFPETARALCDNFYIISDSLGLDGLMLRELAKYGAEAGHELMLCPNPLCPELLEAVLFPGLSLGFVCGSAPLAGCIKGRHIKLDTATERSRLKELAPSIKSCRRLTGGLTNEAVACLAEIKSTHDAIEGIYNPNVDFDGVYALVAKHLAMLGLK